MAATGLKRAAFRVLGALALALAAAGVVLPGLPTTPFLLVAVWAFARASPRWAARIEADPRFGPLLANWREKRAVPVRAKAFAVLSMGASLAILWATGAGFWMLAGIAAVLVCVSLWLLTRPSR